MKLNLVPHAQPARRDHRACSGCSLCLLVCPVWRSTHDLQLTPHGRAKALQNGATATEIAAAVESCTLCAACEPVCPEQIDLLGMIMTLRSQLPRSAALQDFQTRVDKVTARPARVQPVLRTALLPCIALRSHPRILARVHAMLGESSCEDSGEDISLALESGVIIPPQRIVQFLAPLRKTRKIVVADGLLLRHIKTWLPGTKVVSLGEALSSLPSVRASVRATDMYVIEPRAYHADYQRLVKYYDRLRMESGCSTNLDLLRIAIPATTRNLPQLLNIAEPGDAASARWILHGRNIARIVVESVEDSAVFKTVNDCPVVHLAELVDDQNSNQARLS